MGNFVSYYGELYCDKPVDMPTLDRMIGNLTLKLDEEDVATLGAPISMNEVREVLGNVPRGKTPGGLGSSVVQYIPTGLLVAGSIPARKVHFSHKKDVLAMMVIDSSMEVCPVLLVPKIQVSSVSSSHLPKDILVSTEKLSPR